MAGSHCRAAFTQYMRKKPTKFCIKLWILFEANTRHCLKFQIYTRKLDQGQEHGLAHSAVFDLMAHFLDKNRHLYLDNFYSPVKFEQRSICACGTMKSDRGRFPENSKGNLQQDQSRFLRVGKLMAVHWKDKRDVYALSTIHGT